MSKQIPLTLTTALISDDSCGTFGLGVTRETPKGTDSAISCRWKTGGSSSQTHIGQIG